MRVKEDALRRVVRHKVDRALTFWQADNMNNVLLDSNLPRLRGNPFAKKSKSDFSCVCRSVGSRRDVDLTRPRKRTLN